VTTRLAPFIIFHTYAVRDRTDLSKFSSDLPVPDVSKFNYQKLLPSNDDKKVLYENVAILIGRCLKKNMPFFAKFGAGLEKHILHEFSDQMSAKSEVVRLLLYIHFIYQIVWPYIASTFELAPNPTCPTLILCRVIVCMQVPVGITLKGEQKNEDMVEILEDLQKYVPTVSMTESVDVPGESTPVQVHVDKFHHLEIGGDQMTASRTRSSQRIRSNSLRGKDRLEGMVPVVKDWH
jgi:L1 cell adhesion molecule like protein